MWEWQYRSVIILFINNPLTESSVEHAARPYIQTLIRHLRIHAQYNAHFESPYVHRLCEYYTEQAKKRSSPLDDPLTFLDYCATKTNEEVSRARANLPESSWNAVEATTERSLLLDHLDWLAKGGGQVSPCPLNHSQNTPSTPLPPFSYRAPHREKRRREAQDPQRFV